MGRDGISEGIVFGFLCELERGFSAGNKKGEKLS